MNIDSFKGKGTEVSDKQYMGEKKQHPHAGTCDALVSPLIYRTF